MWPVRLITSHPDTVVLVHLQRLDSISPAHCYNAEPSNLQDVRSDSTFRIPLIDFTVYKQATSLSEKRCIADDIVNGFKEVGFVYLTGHTIASETVNRVFQKASSHIYCWWAGWLPKFMSNYVLEFSILPATRRDQGEVGMG